MSDDVRSIFPGADESDRQDGQTGLEDYKYLDEEDFDSSKMILR
jgi:hypothetical protein